jgi:hypothetical protein
MWTLVKLKRAKGMVADRERDAYVTPVAAGAGLGVSGVTVET